MLFIFVADMMANSTGDDKYAIALLVFLANFIGSYFPPRMLDKFEQDRLFVYAITSDTLDTGKDFADKLRQLNIAVTTQIVLDKHMNKVVCCKAYSKNRDESRIIKNCLNEEPTFKYHIVNVT